jgi:hypothetical protein
LARNNKKEAAKATDPEPPCALAVLSHQNRETAGPVQSLLAEIFGASPPQQAAGHGSTSSGAK